MLHAGPGGSHARHLLQARYRGAVGNEDSMRPQLGASGAMTTTIIAPTTGSTGGRGGRRLLARRLGLGDYLLAAAGDYLAKGKAAAARAEEGVERVVAGAGRTLLASYSLGGWLALLLPPSAMHAGGQLAGAGAM